MGLGLTTFYFVRKLFIRHCEQSEATQGLWVAAPLIAARYDENDGSSEALRFRDGLADGIIFFVRNGNVDGFEV